MNSKKRNKMSGTSQKYRNFVAEPMGDKPVTDLAGIGETLGGRLMDAGFDKVFKWMLIVFKHCAYRNLLRFPNKPTQQKQSDEVTDILND